MKRIISIILLSASLFANELEVDGGLSVTGEINANNQSIKNVGLPTSLTDAINGNVLQDALRDDTTYEYKIRCLMTNLGNGNVEWGEFNKLEDGFNISYDLDDFPAEVSALFNSGWILDKISTTGSGHILTWWVFKRPI